MGPGVRLDLDVEPGEAVAEVPGEDVPAGAGPLAQLDEGGSRCFGHPQQSVQPERRPAAGQQSQGAEQQQGAELEEQHQSPDGEAEEKDNVVHLDFHQRLPLTGLRLKDCCLTSSHNG